MKNLLFLLALLFATPAQAQNDSYLAQNGIFKSPFGLANTWTATQAFSAAPTVPTAPVGTNTTQAASTAYVLAAQVAQLVTSFTGVDCTGVTDSTTGVQNGINAVGGGDLAVPAGCTLKISSTLTVGNGTSSAGSTVNGTRILGIGIPNSLGPLFGGTYATTPKLVWAGGTSTIFIQVNGPIQGWGLQNLRIDCASTATLDGLLMVSAQRGDNRNLTFNNCAGAIQSTTVPQFGGQDTNTENNSFQNTTIVVPNLNNAFGILLDGQTTNTTSNSDFNQFDNTQIFFPNVTNSNTMLGIVLKDADSNVFVNTYMFGGASVSGCIAVKFDYTDHSIWPASNHFFGLDPAGNTCPTKFQNGGTPGAGAFPNYVHGLDETNGATAPNLANLAFYGSHNITLSSGGNNANALISALNATLNVPTGTFTLGANGGAQGSLTLNGLMSGAVTQSAQTVAGTPAITWGTSSGTPAVTASGPLAITTATGNATCATCATTTNGGALSGTAPVALSAGGAISITGAAGQVLAGAGPAFTATPTLGTNGGTGGAITFNGSTSGAATINVSATGTPQYPGTTTTDNAPAGDIGEYISSTIAQGAAVSITSGAPTNVTSISLTAGDWDLNGICSFIPAATTSLTFAACSTSTTTGANDQTNGRFTGFSFAAVVPGTNVQSYGPVGPTRFSLSTTTTVFLVAQSNFTVSTNAAFGVIRARRVR
jgi:hypothetical protein